MPFGDRALRFLTDFGDQAVILSAFAVVACVLLAQRRRVLAGAWVLAVAGVLGVTLVLKLADQSCGWTVPVLAATDLMNPSGHTASATVVFGCGVGTLVAGRGWRTLAVALSSALAVAGLIAVTRVALGAHSVAEAAAGGTVGVAGVVAFAIAVRTASATGRGTSAWAALPVLAGLAALAVAHGRHFEVEPNIHSASVRTIRRLLPACQPPPGSHADDWLIRRRAAP